MSATPIMMAACGNVACSRHIARVGDCEHSVTHEQKGGCSACGGRFHCPVCAPVEAQSTTPDPVTLLLNEAGDGHRDGAPLFTHATQDDQARRLHESTDDAVSRLLNEAAKEINAASVLKEHRQCPLLADDLRVSALAKIHEAQVMMQQEGA